MATVEEQAQDGITLMRAHARVFRRQLVRKGVEPEAAARLVKVMLYSQLLEKMIEGLETGEVEAKDVTAAGGAEIVTEFLTGTLENGPDEDH